MSVFKITPTEVTPINGGTLDASQKQDEILSNQNAEVIAQKAGEGAPEETEVVGEKKSVTVKVDGPVGKVFTEALNQLLATESYMMNMLPPDQSGATPGRSNLLQVYCWEGDMIDLKDVTEILNEVTRHTDQEFVIAIENIKNVTSSLAYLDKLSALDNVKVFYKREKSLNYIKERVKR